MSSRFIYSCKAFRRASISAMSAAWWSELYSVRVGGGTGAVRAQYSALGLWGGAGVMWSPRLTFYRDPAP